ncbi:MAG: carboxyvinyl-carboxyphosphonate phosphorylmutase [Tindallia sp. MSAO_Bac2]|nr:MAG: carboxyvinyl-carboxyphosphonate phosphorylmutase [Tindallia sp. MSAO_Bac2]
MTQRNSLKSIINDAKKPIIMPGVYDCISAKITEESNFEVCAVTGNGLSASLIGEPDIGLLSFGEVLNETRNIAQSVSIPVIADADTGYGNNLNMIRTVKEMEKAGLAGIFFEDQVFPKKCSYIGGDDLLEEKETFMKKVKAAKWAVESNNFLLIARTDALVSGTIEDAIDRSNSYGKSGADVIFIVGIKSIQQLEYIVQQVEYPVMININEGESLSSFSYDEISEKGVKLIMYPNSVRGAVLQVTRQVLSNLKEKGDTRDIESIIARSKDFNHLMDLKEMLRIEKMFE